jgi:predicted PurR-regulated permease PerM
MAQPLAIHADRRTSVTGMPMRPDTSQLVAAVAVLLLGYLVFLIVRPFATPLVFAVVMVVVFHPLHARLERRLKPPYAAALSTLAVVLAIIVPRCSSRGES